MYSSLLKMGGGGDTASVGQRGMVLKLDKTEKTQTASKGIMQAITHSGKTYVPKPCKQLKFKVDIIILCAEAYNPPLVSDRTSFRRFIVNLDGCVTSKSRTR